MNRIFYFLVYLVFFTTPLETIAVFENFSIVKIVTVFLLGASLLIKRNVFSFREPFLIIFLFYTLLTIMSFIWSIDQVNSLTSSLKTILPSFIVTTVIYNAIQEKGHLERIFMAYISGCLVVSAIALYLFATGFRFIEGEESRVTVMGQDQNELSFLLSFGIVSAVYLINYSSVKGYLKTLLWVAALVFVFVILTTGSRMGLILVLLIASTYVFTNLNSKKVILILPLILMLGIISFSFLPLSITERLSQIPEQIQSHNFTGRVEIWKFGLMAFRDHNAWIEGVGFHTFQSLLESKYNWSASSHNTYLCTFIELGAIGSMLFLAMIACLMNKVMYLVRNYTVFYSMFLLPLLAAMFVLGTNNRRWLFLIGVLIIRISQFEKEERANI